MDFTYQEKAREVMEEVNGVILGKSREIREVMEEHSVTVEGITRKVPEPFLVIATQNPYGSAGTQLLPEAQMDRFMVTMSLGYPDFESELAMAMAVGESGPLDRIKPVLDMETFKEMQHEIHEVYINEAVYRYLLQIVTATRKDAWLEKGAGPRATIALVKLAKAAACTAARPL